MLSTRVDDIAINFLLLFFFSAFEWQQLGVTGGNRQHSQALFCHNIIHYTESTTSTVGNKNNFR